MPLYDYQCELCKTIFEVRATNGDTRLGDELSQALQQLTGAARSLNALADYLQRHPEALLRGKQRSEAR